ncbi:MAG: Asp-tRNA(Asn)/Glu-tRNA(Gln) amidotransferase subunit GatB [Clostridiaceae bacterium]|nr:Asp-tRNA(Asn)/Glu-tRNA(Gln) amidotransferase subunit GatB [Clostridiaceae bacterium]
MTYETVIGLEVHVELATRSKIFCACPTDFGQEANTQCCPVCMGLPGALPVLNRAVVDFALRACLATGCRVSQVTRFDRKNYFYPDLPKAYQISQLHQPIGLDGCLDLPDGGRRIRLREIHIEEDAGKLIHDPWEDVTLIDYNRCGVPLLEIVSQPDLRSAEEALAFLERLREILLFLGISDCRMQEGSLRADVNISVRPAGSEKLGTRTEIKNMNSFKAIGRAIASESRRQAEWLRQGRSVSQETRRWDENKDASFAMRSKEDAQDYRYFPDPDLPAVVIDDAWIERIKASQPELPAAKRQRYQAEFGLGDYEVSVLTTDPALSALFEQTARLSGRPRDAAAWLMGEFLQAVKARGSRPDELTLDPAALARIIGMVEAGELNRTAARVVFQKVLDEGADPDTAADEAGLRRMDDPHALRQVVHAVLESCPDAVLDYRSGKRQAFGFLVGQVMRRSGQKADPQQVRDLLKATLETD